MRIITLAALAAALPLAIAQAQPAPTQPPAAAPGMTPEVRAGAEVRDMQGARVGVIEKVEGDVATVATSEARVQIPLASFGQRDGVLTVTMTEAELNAAARRPPGG
jgi:hypothetical protein